MCHFKRDNLQGRSFAQHPGHILCGYSTFRACIMQLISCSNMSVTQVGYLKRYHNMLPRRTLSGKLFGLPYDTTLNKLKNVVVASCHVQQHLKKANVKKKKKNSVNFQISGN